MPQIVFIIGHPASGKTSLYRRIAQRLQGLRQAVFRLNDREFFWQAIELDAQQEYHRFYVDGSHAITDPRFFDLQTRLLQEHLLETEWFEEWVFVELTSRDYPRLIRQFTPGLLASSTLILLTASQEKTLARNASRPTGTEDIENNRIPDHYILKCYSQPFDLQELPAYFKTALVLENEGDDPAALEPLAEAATHFLLKTGS